MSQTEEAIRRAGALVALAAASALVLFPAVAEGKHGMLALYANLLLGCAAVLLSPAQRAVAKLARRVAEAARGDLRWVGFTGIVLYAVYVTGDVRVGSGTAEEVSAAKVNGFLLFLAFLVGVWTVSLSMLKGMGARPLPPAPEEEEEQLDVGEVNGMAPRAARAIASKV